MPTLTIQPPGTSATLFTPALSAKNSSAIFVDVHWRGFSLENLLYTTSVANCLIVVISRNSSTAGTMAHFNIINSGLFDEEAAFTLVTGQIAAMTKSLGGNKGDMDLLLWKGSGFASDGNGGFTKGHNYADHSGIKDAGYAAVIDRMDKKRPYNQCGSLLFDPVSSTVHELSSAEGDAMSALCGRPARPNPLTQTQMPNA